MEEIEEGALGIIYEDGKKMYLPAFELALILI